MKINRSPVYLILFVLLSCAPNNSTPEGLVKNLFIDVMDEKIDYANLLSPNKENYKALFNNQNSSDFELEFMKTISAAYLRANINIFRTLYMDENGIVNLTYHNSSMKNNSNESPLNILSVDFYNNGQLNKMEITLSQFEEWKIMDNFNYDPNLDNIVRLPSLVDEKTITKLYPIEFKLEVLTNCLDKILNKYAGLNVLEYKINEIYPLQDRYENEYYYIRFKSAMADEPVVIKYTVESQESEQLNLN